MRPRAREFPARLPRERMTSSKMLTSSKMPARPRKKETARAFANTESEQMFCPSDVGSSGVSRYNESSPWKMSFNLREDEVWMQQYAAIWGTIEELLGQNLMGNPLCDFWLNAKLITWDGQNRTGFRGTSQNPEDIGFCNATGILKIGSVYRQGSNCHLQVFLKECRYRERDVIFKSLLSDDEDEGYDTVH